MRILAFTKDEIATEKKEGLDLLLNRLLSKSKKTEGLVKETVSFDAVTPAFVLPPIKPSDEQVSTHFNLKGDKSHALPFSRSGLSYDYWGS